MWQIKSKTLRRINRVIINLCTRCVCVCAYNYMNINPFLMQFFFALITSNYAWIHDWVDFFSLLFCALLLCVCRYKKVQYYHRVCMCVCSLIDKFQHDDTISGGGRVLLLLKKCEVRGERKKIKQWKMYLTNNLIQN